jgi:TPR repeat protein
MPAPSLGPSAGRTDSIFERNVVNPIPRPPKPPVPKPPKPWRTWLIAAGLIGVGLACAALFMFGSGFWWNYGLAHLGFSKAQYVVGADYKRGHPIAQDYGKAALWFKRSADHGFGGAEFEYGVLRLDGLGVPADRGEAMAYLERAANQGIAGAQFMLGGLSFEDPSKNLPAGEKWLVLAAKQRFAPAEYYLANKYIEGTDLPENYRTAYLLLADLKKRGFDGADLQLKALQYLMPPDDINAILSHPDQSPWQQ